MSVLKYFKNIPRSPSHRATGPKCNFFFQICNEIPGEKKGGPVAPPKGDRGLSPTPGATGACRPLRGRQGPLPRCMPPFSLWFEPKNSEKKASPSRHFLCHLSLKIYEKNWSGCRVVTSFWNGGRALLLGHICLGKECDIWEFRDRRAEQWQLVISYSQLDTL